MKVNFYLDKRDPENELPIYLFFSFDGKRLKFYTGEKVYEKDWNPEKRRVKSTTKGAVQINALLESLEEEVKQIYREARIMKVPPTIEYIKGKLSVNKSTREDFFEAMDLFIKTQSKERDWQQTTVDKFEYLKNDLSDFARSRKFRIEFDSIDIAFFEKLSDYYLKLGRLNTTIQKKIELLKWFLNWAFKRGINKNHKYQAYTARKKQVRNPMNQMFLSWSELLHLYSLKIESRALANVRDVFCFGCFTGLRHSDLKRLKKTDIRAGKIYLTMLKDPQDISIPLNDYAQTILRRYERLSDDAATCYLKPKNERGLKKSG